MSKIGSRSIHDRLPGPAYIKVGDKRHPYEFSVFTREELVSQQLDLLPEHVWTHKDWKFLNPVSKSGAYELEMFRRLMKGLAGEIPNVNARRAWIVEEMIWSFCPTYATWMICRRNYVGKASGNVKGYAEVKSHVYQVDYLNKSEVAMATGDKVKFDVIVGNPPYQKTSSDRKGSNAAALYPPFVDKALECNPMYLSMVIPSKWMTGDGQGTTKFLRKMLANKGLSKIVVTDNASEWFPDIDLKGGAMYFMIDSTRSDEGTIVNGIEQDLSGANFIIVDPFNVALAKKVLKGNQKTFDELVFGLCPHGITSNHDVWSNDAGSSYVCYYNDGTNSKGTTTQLIDKGLITKNVETIHQWKVCTSKTSGKGNDGIAYTFVAEPGSVVTHTYVLLASFDSEDEAVNVSKYLNTKFAQYMISILKGTINVSGKIFSYLPVLDFTKSYTDADLYAMFGLTDDEIAHIENTTKDFPMFRASNKGKKS